MVIENEELHIVDLTPKDSREFVDPVDVYQYHPRDADRRADRDDHDRRHQIRKSDDIEENRTEFRALSEDFYYYRRTDLHAR